VKLARKRHKINKNHRILHVILRMMLTTIPSDLMTRSSKSYGYVFRKACVIEAESIVSIEKPIESRLKLTLQMFKGGYLPCSSVSVIFRIPISSLD